MLLPFDVLGLIAEYVTFRTFLSLRSTCHALYHRTERECVVRYSRIRCRLYYDGGWMYLFVGEFPDGSKEYYRKISRYHVMMTLPLIHVSHLDPGKQEKPLGITTEHLRGYRQTGFLGVVFEDPFASPRFGWGPPATPTTLEPAQWLLEIFTEKYSVPTVESYASYTDPLIDHYGHDPKWSSRYHDFDRILVEIGSLEKVSPSYGEWGGDNITDDLRFDLTDTSVPFDGTVFTSPPYHNRRYYGMHYTPRCYCYTNARKSWCGPVGPCGPVGDSDAERKHEIKVKSLEQKRQHKRDVIPKQARQKFGRKGR